MGFLTLSDGTSAGNEKEYASPGGNFGEPIPEDTDCLAAIEVIKWDTYQDEEYVSIQWAILQPAEHKNRKIFQKVKVNDADPKKADKAKRMLAAIDANHGGKLAKLDKEPTDQQLASALVTKLMVIKLGIWEIEKDDGSTKSGNWIKAVSPKKGAVVESETKAAPKTKAAADMSQFDDDIPF